MEYVYDKNGPHNLKIYLAVSSSSNWKLFLKRLSPFIHWASLNLHTQYFWRREKAQVSFKSWRKRAWGKPQFNLRFFTVIWFGKLTKIQGRPLSFFYIVWAPACLSLKRRRRVCVRSTRKWLQMARREANLSRYKSNYQDDIYVNSESEIILIN